MIYDKKIFTKSHGVAHKSHLMGPDRKQGRIHGRQMRPSAQSAHLYSPHRCPPDHPSPPLTPPFSLSLPLTSPPPQESNSRVFAYSKQKRYGRTNGRTSGRTDRRTDGPTDRPTDGWTDRPSYRDAWTHLKSIRVSRAGYYVCYSYRPTNEECLS